MIWEDVGVSDGIESFADGPPECPLAAFIWDPGHSSNVTWEVRSPMGEIIAEGFCPTSQEAKAEAEAFICSHLIPTADALAAARQRLLAIEADLSL